MDNRIANHRAKMKRKAARVVAPGFTPMDDKRFAAVRARFAIEGHHVFPNIGKPILAQTSHAQVNCKTGKPHQHKREIARRLRQVPA